MEPKYLGLRLKEERNRIGVSQQALADTIGASKATVQNWEGAGGRDTQITADKLESCARLGMDVQYVLTGIRSKNLDAVAEEAGSYMTEQGVGALSREEQKVIEMYRLLRPPERTRLREIVDWLVSAKVKKDETGSG